MLFDPEVEVCAFYDVVGAQFTKPPSDLIESILVCPLSHIRLLLCVFLNDHHSRTIYKDFAKVLSKLTFFLSAPVGRNASLQIQISPLLCPGSYIKKKYSSVAPFHL